MLECPCKRRHTATFGHLNVPGNPFYYGKDKCQKPVDDEIVTLCALIVLINWYNNSVIGLKCVSTRGGVTLKLRLYVVT